MQSFGLFDREAITALEEDISYGIANPGIRGFTTGFPTFDNLTDGFVPGRIGVIGARSGVGKTALMLNMAQHLGTKGIKSGLVSLEMTAMDLQYRILSAMTGVPSNIIRRGGMSNDERRVVAGAIKNLTADYPRVSPHAMGYYAKNIVTCIEDMVDKWDSQVIFVDYLQLIRHRTNKSENRTEELAQVSGILKQCAQTFNVCIVSLAQINRQSLTKGGAGDSDAIRGSDAIKFDSDWVVVLKPPQLDDNMSYVDREIESEKYTLRLDKNRFGPTQDIALKWDAATTKFSETNS